MASGLLRIVLLLLANLLIRCLAKASLIPQQVPCLFIMGDSLFDNGNNNGLATTAKANYPPYGIDFPDGPTGRFSNGRNMVDVIATLLGFEDYIKPYATATEGDILRGVNYASGSSGIRDETGYHLGDRISLNRQLSNHETTVSRVALVLGSDEAAAKYLSKCLFIVGTGSNDYINNYLIPQHYSSSTQFTPQQYANVLAQQYSHQLRGLYKLGARKVALFGLARLGCTPFEIGNFGSNGSASACVDMVNKNVQLFNDQLKSLVDQLNHDFVDANHIYINVTKISSGDFSIIGINTKAPCCVVSTSLAKGQCALYNEAPCVNRIMYEYWDSLHPTEVANVYVATRAYIALTPLDAYPFDIHRLAHL